jgi:AmmeMemoRadiSam system protein A
MRSPEAEGLLFELAAAAIRRGLDGERFVTPDVESLPAELREPAAVFVTLEVRGQLNGCIGSMEADDPLGVAVARRAYDSAFHDPRLPRLTWRDYGDLSIEISILSPMQPLDVASEEELLSALRPGVDGLLIESGWNRGTFLPAVWDDVLDAPTFLAHLYAKAGLPGWVPGLCVWRYQTEKLTRSPSP